MKNVDVDKKLTEVEFELMSILWKIQEGTVKDVMVHLPAGRNLAYTSVSTILRILEQKNILSTKKVGRGHVYIPSLSKSDFELSTVNDIVNRVFHGAPSALVKQLLDTKNLTSSELTELKSLIAEYERQQ
ncbi:MAG: BlaI/MecI/CopY family transcriptional regulator [Proteobacteria bacterium]|nr:BlaI/MecI/CopY family transcriptional regulator [Pseudomonadota bacterium]